MRIMRPLAATGVNLGQIVRQWFEIVIQGIWVSRAHSNLKTIFCSTTGQQATGLSCFSSRIRKFHMFAGFYEHFSTKPAEVTDSTTRV